MHRAGSNARWVAVLMVVFAAMAGCESVEKAAEEGASRSSDGAPLLERRWLGELSLERVMGEEPPVVLGLPSLLTAGPDGGFALGDLGNHTIRAFDAEGRERWTFGRDGKGPGEFSTFTSLMFNQDRGVAVLDPEQQRVTVIDDHGQLSSTTPLPDLAMRLLPVRFSNGGLVIMPRDSAHLWVEVSLDGQRGDTMLRPPELRVESPLIGESFVSRSSMGAIVAHRWSSRLAFLDEEGGVRGIVDGIEPVSFPMLISPILGVVRIDPEATRAARDVGAASGRVYVLFVGTEIVDARVVDVYDEESMSYIGSYRVPANVIGLAALSDGRLATLEHDPVPVVRIWTMGDPARSELPDGR